MATLVDFRARFTEFSTVTDILVQDALDDAALFQGDVWKWDGKDRAQMYLAAHFLAVAQATSSTSGRDVTSETIGRLSRSYRASTDGGIGDLVTTSYGKRYLQLKDLGSQRFRSIRNFPQITPRRFGWW